MNKQNTDKIVEFVQKLGFSVEAARVYQALAIRGPMSISELSRESGVERTALYRMMDELTAKGVIDELLAYKSRRYGAADPGKIELLVEQEKQRVRTLEAGFLPFAQAVGELSGKRATQTRYYRGAEGIRQILWNETKAKGPQVAYTYRNLEEVVGVPFFRKYAAEIDRRGIQLRDLRSDAFLESTDKPEFVKVHINNDAWRYLPDSVLRLNHNMDIYDDTISIYYWEENDVFGVEIQNQKIADTQRGIFEILWKQAKDYRLPKKYHGRFASASEFD